MKEFKIDLENFSKNLRQDIQESLFKLGYYWINDEGERYIHLDKPFIFVNKEGMIEWGDDRDFFNKIKVEELKPNDLL